MWREYRAWEVWLVFGKAFERSGYALLLDFGDWSMSGTSHVEVAVVKGASGSLAD